MDYNTYVQTSKVEMDRFQKFWQDSHTVKPDEFPADMEHADWDEQFEAWHKLGRPATYAEMRTATLAPTGWKGVP